MPPGKHLTGGVPVIVRADDGLEWSNADTGIWLRRDRFRTYDRLSEFIILDSEAANDAERFQPFDVLLDLNHPHGMGHALTVLFGWMDRTELGYVSLPGLKTERERERIVDRHLCGESTDGDRAIVAAACIAIG